MKRIDFECPFDLANAIIALLGDIQDDYPTISVYGKYDVIKDILEDLIASGVSIANEIELQDYEVDYYDKEFVLYVTLNGINVEKTWCDGIYYYGSANLSFVHEDCNSKILDCIESNVIYEFGYDEVDDECDCDECDCCDEYDECDEEVFTVNGKSVNKTEFDEYVSQFKKIDENPVATKESYFINGKSVDKSEFDKKYEEFEEMYMDNIRDMMLNYCTFMDSVNEWRSRLLRW